MSAETWYSDPDDGWVEITERVFLEGWELREDSEEGSTPTSTLAIADPDMDFYPIGHRPMYVLEPTSESDDDVLWGGYSKGPKGGRGQSGGEEYAPLARAWQLAVNDKNARWGRKLEIGSDCNRPDETDVERIQWVLSTAEADVFDDVTTYINTGSTVDMDACDYRGQYIDQIFRDCAEQSGKNWWAKLMRQSGDLHLVAWYGRDSLDTYDSTLFLTNDSSVFVDDDLLDGTSLVWPVADETGVEYDWDRVYCGILGQYDGGQTRRHRQATHDAWFTGAGHRDMVMPMPNVKRLATAQRRADRALADLAEPDIHVTTVVRLPAAKATLIRAGMRIQLKLTHMPELTDWTWCRIVNCTPKPVAAGTMYDLALEMTPTGQTGTGPPLPPYEGDVFAGLQRSGTNNGTYGTLEYGHNYDTNPAAGWDTQATTGPISIDQADPGNYCSMTVSQAMVVRIYARAFVGGVAIPAVDRSMYVKVNGVVVGTATHTLSGGLAVYYEIDLRDYTLAAGDVVSIDSQGSVFWTNSGNNGTQLIVGRGSYPTVNLTGPGTTFTGP